MTFQTHRHQVPGMNSNPAAPILGLPLLTHGSLIYVEPARDGVSAAPAAAGARLLNWARGSCARLTGGAMADQDAEVLENSFTSVNGRLELTSKGALHGYVQNTAGAAQAYRLGFMSPDILAYIRANPAHQWYFDSMLRKTREPAKVATPNLTYNVPPVGIYEQANTSGNAAFYTLRYLYDSDDTEATNTQLRPAAGGGQTVGRNQEALAIGVVAHNSATRGVSLPSDWGPSDPIRGEAAWAPPSAPGGVLQGGLSFIFYSVYLEDLTVSGRTHDAVRALRADQVAADFGTGGRYHGETWTNPASVTWA